MANRLMPTDLKGYVANEVKLLIRENLKCTLHVRGFEVLRVDTADNLQAHIQIQTDIGVRTFTIQVKEIH